MKRQREDEIQVFKKNPVKGTLQCYFPIRFEKDQISLMLDIQKLPQEIKDLIFEFTCGKCIQCSSFKLAIHCHPVPNDKFFPISSSTKDVMCLECISEMHTLTRDHKDRIADALVFKGGELLVLFKSRNIHVERYLVKLINQKPTRKVILFLDLNIFMSYIKSKPEYYTSRVLIIGVDNFKILPHILRGTYATLKKNL